MHWFFRPHGYTLKSIFMSRVFTAVLLLAVFLLATSYIGFISLKHKKQVEKQAGAQPGFAVVELFTSEGCSSCPPADEAVAQLLNSGKKNVYVLGFHVDYWNSLGWKDVYSSAQYSERQQEYAQIFSLNSVYTPQAVVSGKTEFTGSDTRRLNGAVEESLNQQAVAAIEISAKGTSGNTADVSYKLNMPFAGGTVNIALVQLHAQSRVQRGENSGRVLNHVNVVRDFKTISSEKAEGSITLQLPPGLTVNDCEIIAFTQDAGWKITSATGAAIR